MNTGANAGETFSINNKRAGIVSRFRGIGCGAMADSLEQIYRDSQYSSTDFDTGLEIMLRARELDRDEKRRRSLLRNSGLPSCPDIGLIKLNLPRGIEISDLDINASASRATDARTLILSGPTGVGKTTILTHLGRSYCNAGLTVMYRNTENLLRSLACSEGRSREQLFRKAVRARVLILDDFCIRAPMDHDLVWELYNIVDERPGNREQRRPVFIGTQPDMESEDERAGLSPAMGGTALAESVADRLVNPSDLFVLSGESRRKGLRSKKADQ